MQISHNQLKVTQNLGPYYAARLPQLGEVMASILRLFDCHAVYGVGGDFVANLITAFEGEIATIPSSNEIHAGYSACAQAEISGLGAVLTTYTVGSLPCTSPAALAMAEKLPVVFISGAPGEGEIAQQTLHHTVASSSSWATEYDCALDAFRALGMRAERLQGARAHGQPNMAAERFFQLVTHAYLNKEPVFVEVPRDLVFAPTQALKLPQDKQHVCRQTYVLEGAELIADHIVTKLSEAKFPLLFIGENVRLNKALCQQLMMFSHKHRIPFATSWLAKGVFNEQDPLCVGSYNGVFSPAYIRSYVEHTTDYILEVDTSIQTQDTNNAFCSGTHAVESFANKTMIKGTVQNQQGLINIFECLLRSDIPQYDVQLPAKPDISVKTSDKLDFHNLVDTLNAIQSQLACSLIYLPEVGNSYFASYGLITRRSKVVRSWLTNPWYGAMGSSLPYARAVARTLKSKGEEDIAVVITGDGGFHFQLNELVHFQREKLAVIIVYMRNNIFHLGKSSNSEIYQCSTHEFDVIKLIEAYGGEGIYCETVGQFTQHFTQAVKRNRGITLLEIPADVDAKYQSPEIAMLNLFIQKNNGVPGAREKWETAIAMQ